MYNHNYVKNENADGLLYFTLNDSRGQLIGTGETYNSVAEMEAAISAVKAIVSAAKVLDLS